MQWNLPRPFSDPEGGHSRYFQILVNIYRTTCCPIPGGSNPFSCRCENLTLPRDVCAECLISGTFVTPVTVQVSDHQAVIFLQMLASSCQQRTWTTRWLSTISHTINYLMHGDSPTQCKLEHSIVYFLQKCFPKLSCAVMQDFSCQGFYELWIISYCDCQVLVNYLKYSMTLQMHTFAKSACLEALI
jgi:hypothetical protein